MLFYYRLFPFLNFVLGVCCQTQCHDDTFVPDAILRITQENIAQSCLSVKPTVVINGTSPGPELRLLEGKTYWIRVYNDIENANLTMHWHGLSMAVSPFSDGSPSASQWPIPPAHFFDYEIKPRIGMAGTYFYHSHVGFQSVSASGPLIVDHIVKPYHYDEERIVFLQDVFTRNDSDIEQGLVHSPLVWSGETSMITVNGKGGGSANGTYCNASLSTIDVEPGKTYRVRFIGSTALTFASLAVEGHTNLLIIEADGSSTQPYETDHLQLGAGQRYSILFTALRNPTKQQYYIQLESRERPTLTRGFAVLNYGPKPSTPVSPPVTPVLTLPNTTYNFLDYVLKPYDLRDVWEFPKAEDVTRRVTIRVHQHVNGRTIWLENGLPWTENVPAEPYLVSLYKNDGTEFPNMQRALANNGIDPVTSAFPAQIGEVLEVVIQNTGADSGGVDVHPWHAHGGHYWDIGAGNGTYDPAANELRLKGTQPVKRDTTMLYKWQTATGNGTDAGWRAWRIRVQEPGVWMIHCHILEHMLMGMQTVWVMGNETELLSVPKPEVEGYLTYGGNVYGNESHWPSVVHFQDNWEAGQK